MPAIAARASWGPRGADGDLTLAGLAREVFVHHSVTAQLPPNATVAQERAQMRVIEQIGQDRFGTGISYNVVVFPSGRAYQGVSWNRRGTHTGGRNSTARSICFAGNYEDNTPTAAALATAAAIYADGKGIWWTVGAPLRGHREVSSTACPGRNLWARLDQIRTPGHTPTPPVPTPAPNIDDMEALMAGYPFTIRSTDNDVWTVILSPTRRFDVSIPNDDSRARIRAAIITLFGEPQTVGEENARRIRAQVG